MRRQIDLSLLIILPVLISALGLKLVRPSAEALSITPLSSAQLSLLNLKQRQTVRLSPQSDYQLFSYQATGCRGSIALVRLQRNAEGATLLRNSIRNPDTRFGFMLNGEIRPSFPALEYNYRKLMARIFRHSSAASSGASLFAWAELGQCGLADEIAPFAGCDTCGNEISQTAKPGH